MARRDPGWLCYIAHATTGAPWTRLVANAAQLHGSTALTRSEPQLPKRLHLFFGGASGVRMAPPYPGLRRGPRRKASWRLNL